MAAPREPDPDAIRAPSDGLAQSFAEHRDRLVRMVRLRLDRRLQGRVDASDVVQDALLEATQRYGDYQQSGHDMPLFLWLRFIATQKLAHVHRQHLGVQARDVEREVQLGQPPSFGASSQVLAADIAASSTSPSQVAMRDELRAKLEASFDQLPAADRELLAMRHFEQLSHSEIAGLLGIAETAVRQRYVRALRRLKDVLGDLAEQLTLS